MHKGRVQRAYPMASLWMLTVILALTSNTQLNEHGALNSDEMMRLIADSIDTAPDLMREVYNYLGLSADEFRQIADKLSRDKIDEKWNLWDSLGYAWQLAAENPTEVLESVQKLNRIQILNGVTLKIVDHFANS